MSFDLTPDGMSSRQSAAPDQNMRKSLMTTRTRREPLRNSPINAVAWKGLVAVSCGHYANLD
jgi:hypothetical protein